MAYEDDEAFVIGPDGERMTLADLPDAATTRWIPRRKARVVAAVNGGLISEDRAMKRYQLTIEELDSWRSAYSHRGLKGLQVTKLSSIRRSAGRGSAPTAGSVAPDSGAKPSTMQAGPGRER